MSGAFSSAVNALAEQLVLLRMHVESAIDFPEEEIDFLSDDALLKRIDECAAAFTKLQAEAKQGRVLRDGFQVVIVGKPNVGKSSLLNLLSGQEAAIVTEVAGTTRDVLREQIDVDGLAVELVDTAGLRSDPDRIEAEGIRRAREALANADAVLWIQDATDKDQEEPKENLPDAASVTIVHNKIDLSGDVPGLVDGEVYLSAQTGEGIDSLRRCIRGLAGYENQGEGAFTARRRHVRALQRAADHFTAGRKALEDAGAGEILAEELRLAQQAVGQIVGQFTADDLLGRIFSEFCIGK
jgi:tRNA modification GTPase